MTSPAELDLEEACRARVGTTLLGKWVLDELLGLGGMGAVYAGTHRNGSRVAIKMLHAQLASDLDATRRFRREGYVANKVNHPGSVRVIDDDVTEDGTPFLVMPLLQGRGLHDVVAEREGERLAPHEVLEIAGQVLATLIAAHAAGVVHRDLKPENLFLEDSGTIRILDFGIARLRELSGNTNHTKAGTLMGTPSFMPPEQALGYWDQIDGRTDLWAVGAVMFTLLTGKLVHHAKRPCKTPNEELLAAMSRPAPPVREACCARQRRGGGRQGARLRHGGSLRGRRVDERGGAVRPRVARRVAAGCDLREDAGLRPVRNGSDSAAPAGRRRVQGALCALRTGESRVGADGRARLERGLAQAGVEADQEGRGRLRRRSRLGDRRVGDHESDGGRRRRDRSRAGLGAGIRGGIDADDPRRDPGRPRRELDHSSRRCHGQRVRREHGGARGERFCACRKRFCACRKRFCASCKRCCPRCERFIGGRGQPGSGGRKAADPGW